jgi:hypothetical protein
MPVFESLAVAVLAAVAALPAALAGMGRKRKEETYEPEDDERLQQQQSRGLARLCSSLCPVK